MTHASGKLDNSQVEASPFALRTVRSLAQAAESGTVVERQLVEGARQLLQARIKMAKLVPKGLFREPAWDMMLELFISGEEGGILFVKQLMIASGESSGAAMRRIDRLEDASFIARLPDPLDQRRVIVRLTERGRTAMIAMLQHVFNANAEPKRAPIPYQPRR